VQVGQIQRRNALQQSLVRGDGVNLVNVAGVVSRRDPHPNPVGADLLGNRLDDLGRQPRTILR
jgi:hypothetical protein